MLLGTLRFMHKTVSCYSNFFWIDYFCLRQCQADFEPQVILKLV
jgi:hypothetical protein